MLIGQWHYNSKWWSKEWLLIIGIGGQRASHWLVVGDWLTINDELLTIDGSSELVSQNKWRKVQQ